MDPQCIEEPYSPRRAVYQSYYVIIEFTWPIVIIFLLAILPFRMVLPDSELI